MKDELLGGVFGDEEDPPKSTSKSRKPGVGNLTSMDYLK